MTRAASYAGSLAGSRGRVAKSPRHASPVIRTLQPENPPAGTTTRKVPTDHSADCSAHSAGARSGLSGARSSATRSAFKGGSEKTDRAPKKASRRQAWLAFRDESGLMLAPLGSCDRLSDVAERAQLLVHLPLLFGTPFLRQSDRRYLRDLLCRTRARRPATGGRKARPQLRGGNEALETLVEPLRAVGKR